MNVAYIGFGGRDWRSPIRKFIHHQTKEYHIEDEIPVVRRWWWLWYGMGGLVCEWVNFFLEIFANATLFFISIRPSSSSRITRTPRTTNIAKHTYTPWNYYSGDADEWNEIQRNVWIRDSVFFSSCSFFFVQTFFFPSFLSYRLQTFFLMNNSRVSKRMCVYMCMMWGDYTIYIRKNLTHQHHQRTHTMN